MNSENENYKKLFTALKNSQYNEAEAILSQGANINHRNSKNENLLWRALELDNKEMFEWLLEKGCSLDDLNRYDESLILHAVQNNNILFLNMILNISTKNINTVSVKGFSPLMLACSENKKEIIDVLINFGCDINAQNQYLNNALLIAISKSNFEIVELLINHNADINLSNSDGDTPLIISAKYRKLDSLLYLLENSSSENINKKNKYGSTVTSFIMNSQFINDMPEIIIDLLIQKNADFNVNIFGERASSPFLESIKIGDINTFLKIINTENVNVNVVDSVGNDIVHYLCVYNYLTPRLLERIIECGYDTQNVKSIDGLTPYYALLKNECSYDEINYMVKLIKKYDFKNHYKTLPDENLVNLIFLNRNKQLLDILFNNKVVDINFIYKDGNKIIHKITEIVKISEEMGIFYLENEINFKKESLDNIDQQYYESTIEHIREQSNEISKMKNDIRDFLSYIINKTIENKMSINELNNDGDTPLMLLIASGQSLTLEYFLEYNPSILIDNEYGENTLCYAIKYGRLDVFEKLFSLINNPEDAASKLLLNIVYNIPEDDIRRDIAIMSIEKIIDIIIPYINNTDENGNTALIIACALNETNMVNLLLKYGANTLLKNNSNETALMHASANNNINMVKMLIEKGAEKEVVNNKNKKAVELTTDKSIIKLLIRSN